MLRRGGIFPHVGDSQTVHWQTRGVLSPRLWTRHPSDPAARILRPSLRRLTAEAARGLWAGKLAAHPAHHRFGAWGRLPHVQLNLWRVGVKGSGSAMRVPMPVPRVVLRAMTVLGLLR